MECDGIMFFHLSKKLDAVIAEDRAKWALDHFVPDGEYHSRRSIGASEQHLRQIIQRLNGQPTIAYEEECRNGRLHGVSVLDIKSAFDRLFSMMIDLADIVVRDGAYYRFAFPNHEMLRNSLSHQFRTSNARGMDLEPFEINFVLETLLVFTPYWIIVVGDKYTAMVSADYLENLVPHLLRE